MDSLKAIARRSGAKKQYLRVFLERYEQLFEPLWPATNLLYIVEDLHMLKAKGTEEYFRNIPGADFDTKNLCVITKTQTI